MTEITVAEELKPADLVACGAGRGAECCKFIVVGERGAECARFSSRDQYLREVKHYVAQRIPTEEYPLCQIFGEKK